MFIIIENKKQLLFILIILSNFLLAGCSGLDSGPILSSDIYEERNIETEFVDGVVLDRKFSTDSSTGHHRYSVVIGYYDLETTIQRDAELYNEYNIGDEVPVQLVKNLDNRELDRLKYVREYGRNKLLRAKVEQGGQ